MKRFLKVFCVVMLVVLSFSSVFANGNDLILISTREVPDVIRVQVNGEFLDFTDSNGEVVNPQAMNGRTMVPFRKIFNSLGVEDSNITWDADTNGITAKKDNVEINLTIGSNNAIKKVDGVETPITLDAAPVAVNNRTLVPLRFIAESLGKKVGWDGQNKTAIIIDDEFINQKFEEKVPKLYEIAKLQTTPVNSFKNVMTINGTLKYNDTANKANKSEVKFNGKANLLKTTSAISMDCELKLTGLGPIYDEIKNADLQTITASIVLNELGFYIKTSLLDTEPELKDKWVFIEIEDKNAVAQILNAGARGGLSLSNAIREDELTIYSVRNVDIALDLLQMLIKDSKITNTTSGAKCTIEFDLMKAINESAYSEDLEIIKGLDITLSNVVKDGVLTQGKLDAKVALKQDTESVDLTLVFESKMTDWNNEYKIETPSKNSIVIY